MRPFAAPTARTAAGRPIRVRLLGVAAGFAERNLGECVPGRELERRALELQLQVERGARAREVLVELARRLGEHARGTGLGAGSVRTTLIVAQPEHGPQARGGGGQCQAPEWCRVARGGEIGV